MLTGKCKQDFEEWLFIWVKKNIAWETETPKQEDVDRFYQFPLSMKWGVYADFFITKSIDITLGAYKNDESLGDPVKNRNLEMLKMINSKNEFYNN